MNARSALSSYAQVHVNAGVEAASAHRLIQMLFEGLLERIAQAKGAMQQRNFELKGQKLTDAISIVLGLKDALDREQGGELADNLDSLYDYLQSLLWQANSANDSELLDQAVALIKPVSNAWKDIA